ncbi:hypothetical protein E3U55_10515 [Filobacillus milosensis]|uniref:DUF3953 domain-containing protein n=1 Tax=Filobacillus milosensis TaxID=94137 RepID=A0A4Y8IJW1_9BACI|nr:hypothetical protein [Filobacillus milosensis]TFB19584.1 hypothetical protein E3U55_10515 [Filobacillus milosensis]
MFKILEVAIGAIALILFGLHYLSDAFYLPNTYIFLIIAALMIASGLAARQEGKKTYSNIYLVLGSLSCVIFIFEIMGL